MKKKRPKKIKKNGRSNDMPLPEPPDQEPLPYEVAMSSVSQGLNGSQQGNRLMPTVVNPAYNSRPGARPASGVSPMYDYPMPPQSPTLTQEDHTFGSGVDTTYEN